ncbi:MAG: glycosyltransferase family 2 protein [Ignavibacteria bacterium]|nr:glycosyltransferase family 2 protein [Ignavibacteria bacterium]
MIEVIIPNYNGKDHIKECLDSLRIQTEKNFSITIVDNASEDGSDDIIAKEYPEVNLIRLNKNFGFAKAINYGIKEALKKTEIKYIILLNNDIKCDRNFIKEMISGFVANDVGSVASKMLNYYDNSIIDAAGDYISWRGLPTARGNGMKDTEKFNKGIFMFSACAGAAAYKREVFEQVGFFDEDFYAYFEDVDFGFRLQLMGYRCYYNPKAICYHKREATFSKWKGLITKLCEKNLLALRLKNYPILLLIIFQPIFFASRCIRYWKFLKNDSFETFKNALLGYFLGLREIPKTIRKRRQIQKLKKISNSELLKILKSFK